MNSLENSNLDIIKEAKEASLKEKKLTLKPFIFIFLLIGAIAYFYAILFGERSIFVLIDDENQLSRLQKEYDTLQNQNQKLQKKYFELIQLTPDEDAF